MTKRSNGQLPIFALFPIFSLMFALEGCAATTHPVTPTKLGQPVELRELEAKIDQPGPLAFEAVTTANWVVDREGLINLEHPKAKAAGLENGDEKIRVDFFALEHPTSGLYLVDSGIDEKLIESPSESKASWILRQGMHLERLSKVVPTGEYLRKRGTPVQGVFLTHLHPDHSFGLADVPVSAKVYVGPGEAEHSEFMHLFVQGTTDRLLEGRAPLEVFERPATDTKRGIQAIVDVFRDGSLFALHVPGHTPGSMAFVARTTDGPVLMTGDTCHTAWGWENEVEPGGFTSDHAQNALALKELRGLSSRHPTMRVFIGHQALK